MMLKDLLFRLPCVLVFLLGIVHPASAQLRISEFMASNSRTLADEDGSYEDWIEIQNVSPASVNLLDWSLTDKASNLTKWRFPATNLPPGGFLVVFASNKNRHTAGAPLHTNFKLGASGSYLALVDPTGTNIVTQFSPEYPPQVPDVSYGFALTSSNVTLVATGAIAKVLVPSVANGSSTNNYTWTGDPANEPFDTSAWLNGATGIGFGTGVVGLNVQSSMLNSNASAFVRIPFTWSNAPNISVLTLNMQYDDGFIAWINGIEVARAFAPIEDLAWNSTATGVHTNSGPDNITFAAPLNLLRNGTNILAIQGFNMAPTNKSFLVLPELVGTIVSGETATGVYFAQPTPGSENLGGSAVPGPGIANATHTPNVPLDNENLNVTTRIFPTANPIANVTMHYRVMFNSEVAVTMSDDGAHGDGAAGDGIYGATIPASASTTGQMVRYYITASDTSNYTSRLPVFNVPTNTAQYFGTVINANYVTSSLPVIHIFAPSSVLQPGPTTTQTGADSNGGGYVSVFYDGEFYDNVFMWLRGNTTANYTKKSHRVTFNKEHPFKTTGVGGRIRHTSFVADYSDPTYMRQGLSYRFYEKVGAAGPFYSPVRLQLNGAFYQLANENDVHGEELLDRLGYDPNGALYNAYGSIQNPVWSTGGPDKKTRQWDTSNADYNSFTAAISDALPDGQRMTNIFDRMDIPEVISYIVAARWTHEDDDVWANMSIYHNNDGDDLWRVIPFDVNLSWGGCYMDGSGSDPIGYGVIQATNDNLRSFPLYGGRYTLPDGDGHAWNRIYDVIYSVPQTREMVLRRLRTVLDTYVKPPGTPSTSVPIEQEIIAWRNLIADEAQRDRSWWGWPSKGGQSNFDPGVGITNGVNDLLTYFVGPRRNHLYIKHSITNTALAVGIYKTDNAGIPLAQPTNAVVNITGFDYNPVSGNQDEEYVQLTNPNSYAVDISDWELDGGIHFKFKGSTVIPANGTLYVSPNTKAFRNRAVSPHGGQGLFVVGPYSGHLNAWGELLTLTNNARSLVASNDFAGNPSPAQRYLRVTEIMYNPSAAPAINSDEQQFEYIELKNISTNVTLNLAGVRFTNGVSFNFTGSAVTSLGPQETALIVRNQTAFVARYGGGFNIAGQFGGALDNGGETVRLEDAVGEKILEFAYDDDWYPITDGLGFSLVIMDETAPWNSWDKKSSWRPSGNANGSPGVTDPAPTTFSPVVVNEVLTHTDLPQLDSVELFNPNTNAVNIGGWFLTDDFYTPKKYRIPNGTTIAAGAYLVIAENQFNTGANAFRLSELGEDIYLFSASATTNLTGYYHGYSFPAAPNGVSFGRYTNSQGNVDFVLQSAVTLNAANAYPRVGPIVISEIMYHPPDTNSADNDLDEFIELHNVTATNVPLYDPSAITNTWRLRNAVDFDFPLNRSLAAGTRLLVVGFNPTNTTQLAAFRAKYGVSVSVAIYGPWSGRLDNSGETLELKQPGPPDDTAIVPFYMVDKVAYSDAAPWPAGADGIGNSLQRIFATSYGNDPTNWIAAGVTAGRATVPDLAPAVQIAFPTSGLSVTASNGVTVSVTASDSDGSIALVQLFGDGVELAHWSSTSSNYLWASVPAGDHALRARATDNLGAVTETALIYFTVTLPPPTVDWISPTNGAIVQTGSSLLLSATALSGSGPASTVNYYLDGSPIGGASPPFALPWLPADPGYHTLSVIAVDANNQTSQPADALIFVQAATANPVSVPLSSAGWKYFDAGSYPGASWTALAFNDTSWSNGVAQLGFGDGDENTIIRQYNSSGGANIAFYFRKKFVVPSLSGITNVSLSVVRDDGVIIYLNGTEVMRDNMPGGTVTNTTLANSAIFGSDENALIATTFGANLLSVGTNILAAEVHQNNSTSSDISFDARLILNGEWLGPAIADQPDNVVQTNGATVKFYTTAIGSGPLAYQWNHNGTNLPGATATNLTLPNVTPSDAGNYQVIVTNSVGAVTSVVATLTIVASDSDGDGIPDAWEQANGTNPLLDDRGNDPDHDGMSNWQEYLAGTSPTNSTSVLKLDFAGFFGTNLIFSFNAASNHDYTVQSRSALGIGTWQKWQDVSAAPSNRAVFLTNNTITNRFFRLATPIQP